MVLADTRSRIDRNDDAAPRKLPAPEREVRFVTQQERLVGVDTTGEYEPAHFLLDEAQQQSEEGVLRHIPVDKCLCRRQELGGIKRDPSIKVEGGLLRVTVDKATNLKADTSTIWHVRVALARRALAYDQAGVLSFEVAEKWANMLFAQLSRDSPPGYDKTSLNQILLADKELFILMGEALRGGLGLSPTGEKKADVAMLALMNDPKITFLLLPLRSGNKREAMSAPLDGSSKSSRVDKPHAATSRRWPPSGAKGKGKGQKAKGKEHTMPAELRGMWHSYQGQPLCFGFNTAAGCTAAQPGARCRRGFHKCCRPHCGGDHPMHSCTSK
jgi:hypothetical protein